MDVTGQLLTDFSFLCVEENCLFSELKICQSCWDFRLPCWLCHEFDLDSGFVVCHQKPAVLLAIHCPVRTWHKNPLPSVKFPLTSVSSGTCDFCFQIFSLFGKTFSIDACGTRGHSTRVVTLLPMCFQSLCTFSFLSQTAVLCIRFAKYQPLVGFREVGQLMGTHHTNLTMRQWSSFLSFQMEMFLWQTWTTNTRKTSLVNICTSTHALR